jgi:hypothetical protein
MRASVRGDDEDNHRNDEAKSPEEGIDAAVEGSGVGIGFGRHNGATLKKVTKLHRFQHTAQPFSL